MRKRSNEVLEIKFPLHIKLIGLVVSFYPLFYIFVCLFLSAYTVEFKEYGFAGETLPKWFNNIYIPGWIVGLLMIIIGIIIYKISITKLKKEFLITKNFNKTKYYTIISLLYVTSEFLASFGFIVCLFSGNLSHLYIGAPIVFLYRLFILPKNVKILSNE